MKLLKLMLAMAIVLAAVLTLASCGGCEHEYGETVTAAPTCTKEGVKTFACALCGDTYSARITRMHNDANVLCLGARVTGSALALDIVDSFLGAEFEGGRHSIRVEMINNFDK